ncbi:hypothetical protein [Aeromicrobium sp. 179-A 4D2 NHS]|uniref:hypothetical protein n=1 Tax=Aeromicrobium sp. 179-A 4D2 NHS TaxID=3142375 RepID=UPI0039A0A0AE
MIIDLRDEYARAIYALNPDLQPWDGEPFTFDEPRNVTAKRDLAIRQADALIASGIAPAVVHESNDWGSERLNHWTKEPYIEYGGTDPGGRYVARFDRDLAASDARGRGKPLLTRVRRDFQMYLGEWTPADPTTSED